MAVQGSDRKEGINGTGGTNPTNVLRHVHELFALSAFPSAIFTNVPANVTNAPHPGRALSASRPLQRAESRALVAER